MKKRGARGYQNFSDKVGDIEENFIIYVVLRDKTEVPVCSYALEKSANTYFETKIRDAHRNWQHKYVFDYQYMGDRTYTWDYIESQEPVSGLIRKVETQVIKITPSNTRTITKHPSGHWGFTAVIK